MNILLIFFVLPLATIIFAIVLQKLIKNPLLVAATIFAIYLIITFAVVGIDFLIAAIIYTILAYIAALITGLNCRLFGNRSCSSNCNNGSTTVNNAVSLGLSTSNLGLSSNLGTTCNNQVYSLNAVSGDLGSGELLRVIGNDINGPRNLLSVGTNNCATNSRYHINVVDLLRDEILNNDNNTVIRPRSNLGSGNTNIDSNNLSNILATNNASGNSSNNGNAVDARLNVFPNEANNGDTGSFNGRYRRRN